MAIELGKTEVDAHNTLTGDNEFTVLAGQSLRVETSPDGSDILNEECPAGKSWEVYVFVRITETDA